MSKLIFSRAIKYSLNHFIVVETNNTSSEMTVKEAIDRFFNLIEKHREFIDFDTKKLQLDCDALVYYVRRKNKLYKLNSGKKLSNDFVLNNFHKSLSEILKTLNN